MIDMKMPPQNLRAEQQTLGCQLIDPRTIDEVRDVVTPRQFYNDCHRIIQKALLKLRDSGAAIDAALIAEQLTQTGELEEIGGVGYLLELMETVPHSSHAVFYAKSIVSTARRREAIRIAQKLIESAHDQTKDETELSESAIKAATELAQQTDENAKLTDMETACGELLDVLETGVMPAVHVTIPEVDEQTGGLCPGELVVVGGRTSNGKSLFALQCLDCAAANGWPGLIISEEMARLSLASRQLSSISVIPSDDWIGKTDRLRFDVREHFITRSKVVIAEKCATASVVERVTAKAVRQYGIKIMAVDYAQLLRGSGDMESERIADVCHRMKNLAVKYDLIVLLLAQMNRGMVARENAEPRLSDFKGSGALEEDADVVLCPFWPIKIDEKYPDATEYRIYHLKGRNRGVKQRVLKMRIDAARQRLYPADDQGRLDYSSAVDNF